MANAMMVGAAGTAAVRAFAEGQRLQMLDEIRQLEEVIKDLTPLDLPADDDPPAPKAAKPKRRTGPRPSVHHMAKEAAARREKIVKLLLNRGEELSPQAVKAEIPMSSSQAIDAFKRLTKEGRIRRNGPQTRPMYEAIVKPLPNAPAASADERLAPKDGGTDGGRILGFIADFGGARAADLAERFGLTGPEIEAECGKLIREGEIRYDRRGGETFYILDPSA